ncbi:MAG: MMPL family transporter, partial [Clostridiales bacterium]
VAGEHVIGDRRAVVQVNGPGIGIDFNDVALPEGPNLNSFYNLLNLTIEDSSKQIESGGLKKEEINYQVSNFETIKTFFETTNDGLKGDYDSAELQLGISKFFGGDTLLTSTDGKMAMVTIQPKFDIMDMELLTPGVNAIEKKINEIDKKYKNIKVGATGMHVVARDEMASVESDSYVTMFLSIILILAILYFAFRVFTAPILTFIPLVLGIIWSIGITQLTIGRLNMMTVFSAAMLIGLGIDYAIHLYSSYTEKRADGLKKEEAIEKTMLISGPGIITGAMTTALAFFALNISSLEILTELGTVIGTGIVTTLISVFWVLPAFIVIKKENEEKVKKVVREYKWIGKIAGISNKYKIIALVIILSTSIFMGYKAKDIKFDTNLMNIEPKGLDSIALMEHLVEKYDISTDAFSIEVDNLDDVYTLHEKYEMVDNVFQVRSIASILPKTLDQNEKLEKINKTKEILQGQEKAKTADIKLLNVELNNIKDNMYILSKKWYEKKLPGLTDDDFSEMNKSINDLIITTKEDNSANIDEISNDFYNTYKTTGDKLLAGEVLEISDLPEDLKKQYISEDGEKFILFVYPDFDIWENISSDKGKKFFDDLSSIDDSITGTPVFMKVLFEAAAEETGLTGGVLFVILLIILIIHFKSLKYTILALLPLIFTLIFTLGTMVLIDLQFNMLNFLAILLIVGIGIDDGVHILHHYKSGEKNINRVFSVVGRAILLTTLTTMFGFGSLNFSSYVGIASLGQVLFIGVFYAFIMTMVVLPIFMKNKEMVK